MTKRKKTCLITGGAMGLGYEFAKLAAADGYDLVILDAAHDQLENAKNSINNAFTVKIDTHFIDLSENEIYKQLEAIVQHSDIDILINNAGFGLFGKFQGTDWEIEERMIRLHILTSTFLTKKVLAGMLRKKSGKIMNVSSIAAFHPGPYLSVYYATKAYLRSFSLAVGYEVKNTGVSITLFCPGNTSTHFADQLAWRSNTKRSKVPFFNSDPGKVARIGYEGMLKKRRIVIPGFHNRVLALLARLIPASLSAHLNSKIQLRIRKDSLK
jgi:uncharacterized protein